LCAAGDCADLLILSSQLETVTGNEVRVEGHHSGAGLASALESHLACGSPVPLVIADRQLADGAGIDALIGLSHLDADRRIGKIVAVPEDDRGEADLAASAGLIDGVLSRPWSYDGLRTTVYHFAGEELRGSAPNVAREVATPVTPAAGSVSDRDEYRLRHDMPNPPRPRSFLDDCDLSDEEVEQKMISEIECLLGHPQPVSLPAGTLMGREGDSLDGITVVLDGEVRLFREVDGREVVFHHLTAGRIIGLMALAQSRPAVFSVEAATDVTVLPIKLEAIDAALCDHPSLAATFVSVLLRSLAHRNLRSIEQQLWMREFATDRIRQSERLAVVGQLAAGVAHELNNPLQGIVTYSQLLLEKTAETDPRRAAMEKIVGQSDRCRDIVRALLDFARPSRPQKRPADINSTLRDCLDLMEGQSLFINIEIDQSLDSDLSPVTVDPSQMQQVFMNLIINAVEAMDGTGRLAISTQQTDGHVEIEFTDTGPGISPQDLIQVFDPFFSTKSASHGTGLGLAISYRIVRDHLGEITVESREGAGAHFVVRLPIQDDSPDPPRGTGVT